MRYSIRCANATTCFCALLIALPAAIVVANTDRAYAQTSEEDGADTPKSGIQSAIRSFAAAHGRSENKLDEFYAARNYRAAWTGSQEASRRAVQLQAALKKADEQGLDPAAYAVNERASSSDTASYDVALTDALLRYARDVQIGRVRPDSVYRDAQLPTRKRESVARMAHALDNENFDSFMLGLTPSHNEYRGLARALAHYRDIASSGGWPSVTSSNQDDPVYRKSLIKRLAAEDAVLARTPNPSADMLQAAIARFQSRNGLKADGQLGPNTMAALNAPVTIRIQQIAANMERWRWMPTDFESRYVVINIPDQTLQFVRDGATVMKSRVMVGKKNTRSPILRAEAQSLVVNPPWNVPADIAARSILPNLKSNPNYLAAHNMVMVDGQIRQRPGPNSAMGTLMLDAPNRFDVYLHDTPGKAFFQNDDRELSNGCIRVQDMMGVASLALAGTGTEKFKDIIASRKTTRLTLEDPLPIYMVYWTAIADTEGNVEFRPDRYDRDPPLMKALANLRNHDSEG